MAHEIQPAGGDGGALPNGLLADTALTNDTAPAEPVEDDNDLRWNDAWVVGQDCPEWQALLSRLMVFSIAGTAKAKKWGSLEVSWREWLEGGTDKEGWGFTRHVQGHKKDGACAVFGALAKDERKARAVVAIDCIGVDVDSGEYLQDTVDHLSDSRIAAVVYSSWSDQTTETRINRDDVLQKLKIERDPTADDVQTYLRQHWKKEMVEDAIVTVSIAEQAAHGSHGVEIVLSHRPLDKFRVVFPLAERTSLTDHASTQKAALQLFESKVMGLALDVAKVQPDVSCTDPSRLFYTPRHPKGASDPCISVIRGKPLRYEDIPTLSKSEYLATRRGVGKTKTARPKTPEGTDLKKWAAQGYAVRFEAARAVAELCPERVRNDKGDKLEIECPFDERHGNAGDPKDTACIVSDGQGEGLDGFVWSCRHDSCQGTDRLEMLAKAMADGWFDGEEDFLTEEAAGYLVPEPDNPDEYEVVEVDGPHAFEAFDQWFPKTRYKKLGNIFEIKTSDPDEPNRPICQMFDVVGKASNLTGDGDAARIISFKNGNGVQVEVTLDRADLWKDNGGGVIEQLAEAEMTFYSGGRKWRDDMLGLLRSITPQRNIPTTPRPGWQRDRAGDVIGFMLPTGEYIDAGRNGGMMRLHEDRTVKDRLTAGSIDQWRVAASAAFEHSETNFYWAFTLAAGFVGPVLGLIEGEPCGFNLSGDTSLGKTLAQRLAASVWAAPRDKRGTFFPMNTTTNAIEDLACIGSETVLCLDDIGNMARPADLAPMLFSMSTGAGKSRKAGRGAGLTESAEYLPFVVISNERGLKVTIESASKKGSYKGGISVRYPDIDVTGGAKVTADVLDALNLAKGNFGHAGPVFVRYLIESGLADDPDKLRSRLARIQDQVAGDDAAPAAKRSARVFALVQLAGEIACEAGILADLRAIADVVRIAYRRFMESDEGKATTGADSLLDGLRSVLTRMIGHRIVAAQDADDHYQRDVIGWYTDAHFILDARAIGDIEEFGLSGKLNALITALDKSGALERSGKNRLHKTLPVDVKLGDGPKERQVKNYRIKRNVLGA